MDIKEQYNSLSTTDKVGTASAIVAAILYALTGVVPENISTPERTLPPIEQVIERQIPQTKVQPIPEVKPPEVEIPPIDIIQSTPPPQIEVVKEIPKIIKKVILKIPSIKRKSRAGESYDDEGTLTYNGEKAQRYTDMQQEIWAQNLIRPEGVNALFGRRKIP